MQKWKDRNEMVDWLKARYGTSAIVAEIGVLWGDFSDVILNRGEVRRLHLIDCWTHMESQPESLVNADDEEQGQRFEKIKAKYRKHVETGRVFIHRGFSATWLPKFNDDYFDWVFIDASHDKDSVLTDLRNALRVVRWGGAICGHDFDQRKPTYGVVEAVREFIAQHPSLSLDGLTTTGDDISFMIRVPPPITFQ